MVYNIVANVGRGVAGQELGVDDGKLDLIVIPVVRTRVHFTDRP